MFCAAAGILDREFLVSRERERRLQSDLEAATARLFHQEQQNVELRMNQDQLSGRIHQQQVRRGAGLWTETSQSNLQTSRDINTSLTWSLNQIWLCTIVWSLKHHRLNGKIIIKLNIKQVVEKNKINQKSVSKCTFYKDVKENLCNFYLLTILI